MKKRHLAATALACVVATSLMVGIAAAPWETAASATSSIDPASAAQSAAAEAAEDAENTKTAIEQVAAEQAAEKKEAEMEEARKAAQAANTSFRSDQGTSSSSKSSSGSSAAATKTRTITIDGTTMSYVDSYGSSSAPSSGAGIWKGSDSTTDGSYGYYIGHNPGSFKPVAKACNGSKVTVNDNDGNSRTYTVVDTFVVSRDAQWNDISDRVTSHGESVVLQTCVSEGYKILVAE